MCNVLVLCAICVMCWCCAQYGVALYDSACPLHHVPAEPCAAFSGRSRKKSKMVWWYLTVGFVFHSLLIVLCNPIGLLISSFTPLSCVGDEIEWTRLVMNYKAPFKVYSPPSPAPRSLSLSLALSLSSAFFTSLQAHQRARSGTRDARGGGWTGVMNKSYKLSNLKTTNDYRLFDAGAFDPFLEHV